MADGEYYGMMTFDQSLVTLIADGTIDLAEAMSTATNPHDLKVMLERQGIMQTGQFAGSQSHSDRPTPPQVPELRQPDRAARLDDDLARTPAPVLRPAVDAERGTQSLKVADFRPIDLRTVWCTTARGCQSMPYHRSHGAETDVA